MENGHFGRRSSGRKTAENKKRNGRVNFFLESRKRRRNQKIEKVNF